MDNPNPVIHIIVFHKKAAEEVTCRFPLGVRCLSQRDMLAQGQDLVPSIQLTTLHRLPTTSTSIQSQSNNKVTVRILQQ